MLRYAGKVGTGFGNDEMERLLGLMAPLAAASATVEAPAAAVRGARWIKPELIAEIAFGEVTAQGVLRHASYLGLQKTKPPVRANKSPPHDVSGINISNRARVLFPEASITKGQLANYYETIAPIMLPWAGSRPTSLVRCPQGQAKQCFFQKHDAGSFGDAVRHVAIR